MVTDIDEAAPSLSRIRNLRYDIRGGNLPDSEFYRGALSKLPVRNEGDPTEGILFFRRTSRAFESGEEGPARAMGGKGSGFTGYTKEHVEGHVGAFMQEEGVTRGVLVINNAPCPTCEYLLPRMLPKGSILEVYAPEDYYATFYGTGRVMTP